MATDYHEHDYDHAHDHLHGAGWSMADGGFLPDVKMNFNIALYVMANEWWLAIIRIMTTVLQQHHQQHRQQQHRVLQKEHNLWYFCKLERICGAAIT